MHMPRSHGIELCRRMRADQNTAGAEVVVISNALDEANTAAVRQAGANRWLQKEALRLQILQTLCIATTLAS
jgi:CheY-like chemotaxis protein